MKCLTRLGLLLAAVLSVGAGQAAELKFVTEPLPPYSYEAPGSNRGAGPVADVILAVCARIATACTIEVLPWRRALAMAEIGEVDGIFCFLRTPEREKKFFISEMIIDGAYSLFALDASPFKYTQPKDLDGYTIGAYGPSGTAATLEEVLKSSTSGRAEIDVDNITVLKKLAGGRYGEGGKGLALLNRDVGVYLMKSENISGLKQVGEVKKLAYGIGFSRKRVPEPQFNHFNDALKQLIKEGKVKAILDKYGMKVAG